MSNPQTRKANEHDRAVFTAHREVLRCYGLLQEAMRHSRYHVALERVRELEGALLERARATARQAAEGTSKERAW